MTEAFFIASPGTANGKTSITAALAVQLRARGKAVSILKPIISGWDENLLAEMDTSVLLKAIGRDVTESSISEVSPWRFKSPVSPDIAAKRQGEVVKIEDVITFINQKKQSTQSDILLVEGAGGLMTPVNDTSTMLDLIEAVSLPVILVTGGYLGAIGHALLCIEALKNRGVVLHKVIVNEVSPIEETQIEEMLASLSSHTGGMEIVSVPHIEGQQEGIYMHMPKIL